jgi:hypothetical protein
MKRIYKYPVPIDDRFVIQMPLGAFIMTVQMQKSEPQIWALVDPDRSLTNRVFYLYGTGMEVNPELIYIGTFQMLGGSLVYHLFEG